MLVGDIVGEDYREGGGEDVFGLVGLWTAEPDLVGEHVDGCWAPLSVGVWRDPMYWGEEVVGCEKTDVERVDGSFTAKGFPPLPLRLSLAKSG